MSEVSFPGPVLRVRIRKAGDDWSIDKVTRIPSMTLPQSTDLPDTRGRQREGFWYEAADVTEQTVYRRAIPHPAGASVEVPSEDGLSRHLVSRPEVVFDLLIPDLPSIVQLRIFEAGPEVQRPTVRAPSEPAARLSLRGRDELQQR
jgi:hypothetical protein